ncbi:hypothetical protein JOC86_004861 [Bacillus pakistanensis]|uniref:Uncharacterized protein n=1 Tax=Rossellomorea pakistanensis TaxID=992288 RepID=A0ABS2NK80_9BACI|nr:hypothetical protein [Bacillus pakistanensis]MBM7588264.1 hypothetical protein [Bacillus pakistanensis]
MDKPLKYTFSFIAERFEKILIIILCVQLPLLILHSFITNYIYAITPNVGTIYSVADIYYALFTILFFLYAQIPFVKYTFNEFEGREDSLKNALYTFLVQGFPIFVFSCLISLFIVIGFGLFVIPGVIILSLFITAPIISIIDNKSVWKSIKEARLLFKKHFIKIILLITLWGVFEMGVGIVFNSLTLNITSSYAAVAGVQIVTNMLFYPLFIVLLTTNTMKWREGLRKLT